MASRAGLFVLGCLARCCAGANVTVVACVGDSITVGKRASKGHDYPATLGKMLGAAFEVSNYGSSGATLSATPDSYGARPAYASALAAEADVVVFMLGTNDGKEKYWAPHRSAFKAAYHDLISSFAGAVPIIVVPPPYLGDEALWGFPADAWFLNADMAGLVQQVAAKGGWRLVDCQRAVVFGAGAASAYDTEALAPFYADRVHPLDDALGWCASAVFDEIRAAYPHAPTSAGGSRKKSPPASMQVALFVVVFCALVVATAAGAVHLSRSGRCATGETVESRPADDAGGAVKPLRWDSPTLHSPTLRRREVPSPQVREAPEGREAPSLQWRHSPSPEWRHFSTPRLPRTEDHGIDFIPTAVGIPSDRTVTK
ncbi:SGNH hydrolase-type esterase domain-containing protein [Pelagophyceae sp. CCMP2097]|nr:SGNH hydrolase-type esterase domain-containing protein [Pelagophyceae sp. CCMP2097]|mmetsp:Transcript_5175/g.18316  ORF Transcript_5175/g.18316 Transcript_5175/m.18316 type:complete len:371 (-) Transcript_5175:32-1144(-)